MNEEIKTVESAANQSAPANGNNSLVNTYMNHFKMTRTPFTNAIESDYLYRNDSQNEIFNKLKLTVQNNSFALITGLPGTGKSTMLRSFVNTLNKEQYLVFYVSMSNATPRWLYSIPLEMLGIKPHTFVNDARKQFHNELNIQLKTYNRKVILIIDEAHLLTQSYRKYDLLEEIRFLLNGDSYDSGSPLSLILSGQTEILPILKTERCKAITQRIMYFCKTRNLKQEQVGPYMAAHIRWSGATDNIFSSEAIELIAQLSDGSPRLINKICTHALNYAYLKNERIVTGEIVDSVANNEIIDFILQRD